MSHVNAAFEPIFAENLLETKNVLNHPDSFIENYTVHTKKQGVIFNLVLIMKLEYRICLSFSFIKFKII